MRTGFEIQHDDFSIEVPEGERVVETSDRYDSDFPNEERILSSVSLPSSLQRIEDGTFYHCQNLTTVTVSDSEGEAFRIAELLRIV